MNFCEIVKFFMRCSRTCGRVTLNQYINFIGLKEIVELINLSFVIADCYSPVHKNCSKLTPTEISDLKNGRNLKWECTTWLNDKFPFTFSDNKYIMSNTFNSNFDCKCNTSSKFNLGSSKYIFQNNLDNLKKDNEFNIID